jgi:hypothetical protein
VSVGEATEHQSSSGVIVATGTGATGWARSISRERATAVELPQPADRSLVFFVREAFPSVATSTSLTSGRVGAGAGLELVSEMSEGGVAFGDGIESDRIELPWGVCVRLSVAEVRLALVR